MIFISCIISYCIGSLPFGLWTGLLWRKVDIRTLGSKNIGATNVLRVLGPAPAAVVFLLDTAKGAAGVLLAVFVLMPEMPMYARVIVALCAVLGHTFSPFLKFRGGKGVATTFGALLALNYIVALSGLLVWIIVLIFSRYVSLASLTASYSLPFAAHFMAPEGDERQWMFWLGILVSVLVTLKHLPNIQRLLTGTESKIGQRVKNDDVPAETAEVH